MASRGVRLVVGLSRGGSAGHIVPDLEGDVACGTMIRGGQAVAAELKMIVDPAIGRKEALRVTG